MPKQLPQESEGFNPFGDLIGLLFTGVENGESHCQLSVRPALLNPYGVVHGGVLYSLADTAMGAALYSRMGQHERCMTIEMKVAYFRAVTTGLVECTARVVQRSRRLGYVEADLAQSDSLVARASGTFMILGAPAGRS